MFSTKFIPLMVTCTFGIQPLLALNPNFSSGMLPLEEAYVIRCPNSTAFPLDVADLLESDIQVQGEPLSISFKANPKGEVTAKTGNGHWLPSLILTEHPSNAVEPCTYYVEVMCRRLLLMHTTSNQSKQSADDYVLGVTQTSSTMTNVISVDGTVDKSTKTSTHWLLYLHSESSYFSFGQPFLDFGSSWHKRKKWGLNRADSLVYLCIILQLIIAYNNSHSVYLTSNYLQLSER